MTRTPPEAPTRSRTALGLLLAASLLLLPACDWELYHLYNSVPMPDNDDAPATVYVYIGVDGLDIEALRAAREQGAYPEAGWDLATSVAMFPATSFTSWTRILQTEPLPGFEYEYYDPVQDKVVNHGDAGLITHIVPPLEMLGLESSAYYRAFDHHANGYLDVISNYSSPFQSLGRGLDDLFYVLDPRTQDSPTFAAYIPQTDILGHSYDPAEMTSAAVELWQRIEAFRERHPERSFVFTLFSDHGMNFTPNPPDRLVELDQVMEQVGVTVAASLQDGQQQQGELVAVPILHSRVTYVGLHTFPEQAPAISSRLSAGEGVDLVICRGEAPALQGAEQVDLSWYQLWRDESLLAQFGYHRPRDEYLLPRATDWSVFGLDLPPGGGKNPDLGSYTDEELFGLSAVSDYPDMFYRVRTGFDPISVIWPPQVLVSFELGWVSSGFSLGTATESIASEASHGALIHGGSNGVLLTQERSLPTTVRSDNLLDFFPNLSRHITEQRGLELYSGDSARGLDYQAVPWD